MNKKENFIIPVYGLNLPLGDITSNIKIRPIGENDISLLEQTKLNWLKCGIILDVWLEYDKGSNSLQILVNKIGIALRVFDSGTIGFAGIISQSGISKFPMKNQNQKNIKYTICSTTRKWKK